MKKVKTIIVTAGEAFADIDVLASAIAYSKLLTLEGKKNEVVLPGVLNGSITKTIRSWDLKYVTVPSESDYDVVVVDVSELKYFAKCVKLEQIIEVYDHRYGFQDFWKEKLGADAHIEFVGSCTTLIWEEYRRRGYDSKISSLCANLLATSILSNTLNFGASVTTQRDIDAFEELKKHIDMPKDWQENYFKEVGENILKNVGGAITSDTKILNIAGIDFPITMGQIELWDASDFIVKYQEEIKVALKNFGNTAWFISVPSIVEKKNYMYTESQKIKDLLSKIIPIIFQGDIGVTDTLWMRKEIRKKLFELK